MILTQHHPMFKKLRALDDFLIENNLRIEVIHSRIWFVDDSNDVEITVQPVDLDNNDEISALPHSFEVKYRLFE